MLCAASALAALRLRQREHASDVVAVLLSAPGDYRHTTKVV